MPGSAVMRKAIIAASVAALLVVLYGAAGYWLAPRLLHDALVERAERLGLALEVGKVRTHPFRLTVMLEGVRVLAAEQELARAQRIEADLAWRSLWSDAWRVQQATLHEPWAQVVLGPQGELNWPAARQGAGTRTEAQGSALVVEALALDNGALSFIDRSRAAPVQIALEAIEVRAQGLSTRPDDTGSYQLHGRTAQGATFSAEGGLTLDPLTAQGKLAIAGVPLETVWSLAAPASEPGSGQVQGSTAYAYDGKQLVLSDVVLEGTGLAHAGIELSRLELRSPRIPLPLEARIDVSASAGVAPAGSLHASGTLGFGPFSADLQAQVQGLALAQASRWLPEHVVARIASGTLAADGHVSLGQAGGRYDGAIEVSDARVVARGSDELLVAWQSLRTPDAELQFAPFRAQLGEVHVRSPAGRLVIGEDGRTNFAQVLRQADGEASPAPAADAPLPISLARLTVEKGTLEVVHPRVALSVRGIEGELASFNTKADEPARVELRSARVALPDAEPVPVSASGTIAMQPLAADLQVKADGVPLPLANRWLPQTVAVNIVSGRASVDGRLRIGEEGVRYDGALALHQGRLVERGAGALLLAWDSLETGEASFAFGPFRAQFGEVLARAPRGRLAIDEQGELNVAAVFQGGEEGGNASRTSVAVRRLRIQDGILQFADRSLDNDFAVTVAELAGTVSGFSTEPGNAARVQLKGRVGEYGAARIGGTVNIDEPRALTDVRATLRNLDLAALTPYVVRFAGYAVESGRVSAELRYRVREGRLVGENELTFEQLQLGEKVQREGARDLPLELAVALLADAKGRINLDIPVSGNLNDPQFDFGGLVARALGNVIGKIVSAPFRVLAGVFGRGGEDMDRVAFAPGSASLSPPAEEAVANVAKALADRPRLNVAVQGGYDPQADVEALRRQTARRAIAQRAGVEPEKPLDYGNPQVLQAAERLYLERVGNRLQMLALREETPRYGQALLERLAATMQVDAQSAEKLARARGEMVRAELLSHGVDPARVRLDAPEGREAGKDGVPTVLALDAGGGAAAGATR